VSSGVEVAPKKSPPELLAGIPRFKSLDNVISQGREPMAREPDVSFDDGIWLAWYFINTIVTNETFSVIFHLPDYKAIGNTMQHHKSH